MPSVYTEAARRHAVARHHHIRLPYKRCPPLLALLAPRRSQHGRALPHPVAREGDRYPTPHPAQLTSEVLLHRRLGEVLRRWQGTLGSRRRHPPLRQHAEGPPQEVYSWLPFVEEVWGAEEAGTGCRPPPAVSWAGLHRCHEVEEVTQRVHPPGRQAGTI